MKIYNYHPETFAYTGEGEADRDPLDPTNWLIPGNSTTTPPPDEIEGKVVTFDNGVWIYTDPPPKIEDFDPTANFTYADFRRYEYPPITDYLDGLVKGDQAQMQAYIDACIAVKEKYPKPE